MLFIAQGPKRRHELHSKDPEVARPLRGLFDEQGASGQAGCSPDRILRRKHRGAEHLIPDTQRKAKVDVLGTVQSVMDSVKVRADDEPSDRPETQAGVRVGKCHDAGVEGQHRDRHRTVRDENDTGEKSDQIGHVDEWMGTKDCEHVHVLLGVVELVKAPERSARGGWPDAPPSCTRPWPR